MVRSRLVKPVTVSCGWTSMQAAGERPQASATPSGSPSGSTRGGQPAGREMERLGTRRPARLVVGIPVHADGTAHPVGRLARRFAQRLHLLAEFPHVILEVALGHARSSCEEGP